MGISLLTRMIGPANYGIFTAAFAAVDLLVTLTKWGIGVYLVRLRERRTRRVPSSAYFAVAVQRLRNRHWFCRDTFDRTHFWAQIGGHGNDGPFPWPADCSRGQGADGQIGTGARLPACRKNRIDWQRSLLPCRVTVRLQRSWGRSPFGWVVGSAVCSARASLSDGLSTASSVASDCDQKNALVRHWLLRRTPDLSGTR